MSAPDTAGASDELRDAKKAMERAEEIVSFLPDFAKSRVREVAAVIPKVFVGIDLATVQQGAEKALHPVVDFDTWPIDA